MFAFLPGRAGNLLALLAVGGSRRENEFALTYIRGLTLRGKHNAKKGAMGPRKSIQQRITNRQE
jgi:hypothetical protein